MSIPRETNTTLRKASNALAAKLQREFACGASKKYQGLKPPTCNNGVPCRTCREKYAKKQEELCSACI